MSVGTGATVHPHGRRHVENSVRKDHTRRSRPARNLDSYWRIPGVRSTACSRYEGGGEPSVGGKPSSRATWTIRKATSGSALAWFTARSPVPSSQRCAKVRILLHSERSTGFLEREVPVYVNGHAARRARRVVAVTRCSQRVTTVPSRRDALSVRSRDVRGAIVTRLTCARTPNKGVSNSRALSLTSHVS
jgi:hypothetical protein